MDNTGNKKPVMDLLRVRQQEVQALNQRNWNKPDQQRSKGFSQKPQNSGRNRSVSIRR